MLTKLFNQFQCSTMMLPEHVEALSEHRQEKDKSRELHIPDIDQQQLEEWEWLLRQSLDNKSPLRISYIFNNRRNTASGFVEQINAHNKTIILRTPAETKTIPANRIILVVEG